MPFSKYYDRYQVTCITSSQDNFLGIVFTEGNEVSDKIEVIELDFSNLKKEKIRTSKEEF